MYLNKVRLPPTDQDIRAFVEEICTTAQETESRPIDQHANDDLAVTEALEKQMTAAKYVLDVLKPYCQEEDHALTWSLFGREVENFHVTFKAACWVAPIKCTWVTRVCTAVASERIIIG
jgi:hypothetical protein